MEPCLERYTGCLLGLAVGDAAGFAGSVRMPLLNGFTPTTSHTQMAAYGCNGLLLGLTRGQLSGTMAPPVSYIAGALEEWAALQTWRFDAGGTKKCWLSRVERLGYRRCVEPRVLDVLISGTGTMEEPAGTLKGPEGLMTAAAVGLFFRPERLPRREFLRLGAEAAALTHGDPETFLAGAALAQILSRLVWGESAELRKHSREAGAMVRRCFGRDYPQAALLSRTLKEARCLADSPELPAREAMARLECRTATQVLAGAVYCCLRADSFDAALEAAVAHDGNRGAVAALTGAIYGALAGERSIPAERLELLEAGDLLRELAEDMFRGCPMAKGDRIFDIEWDEKYISTGV